MGNRILSRARVRAALVAVASFCVSQAWAVTAGQADRAIADYNQAYWNAGQKYFYKLDDKTGVLDFRMGVPLAIAGFVGTVIGGVGNLVGAVLGGFFLGVASVLLQALLPESLRPARDAFLYSLVILVLLVRPQGLFVTRGAGERI